MQVEEEREGGERRIEGFKVVGGEDVKERPDVRVFEIRKWLWYSEGDIVSASVGGREDEEIEDIGRDGRGKEGDEKG